MPVQGQSPLPEILGSSHQFVASAEHEGASSLGDSQVLRCQPDSSSGSENRITSGKRVHERPT